MTNKLLKIWRNVYVKGLIFGSLFFLVLYLSDYLIFMDYKILCAKIESEGGIKGQKGLIYIYRYNGEVYRGSFYSSEGISVNLHDYDNRDCFEVEVSTIFPSMSRVHRTYKKYN